LDRTPNSVSNQCSEAGDFIERGSPAVQDLSVVDNVEGKSSGLSRLYGVGYCYIAQHKVGQGTLADIIGTAAQTVVENARFGDCAIGVDEKIDVIVAVCKRVRKLYGQIYVSGDTPCR
jgi:hypothetical protein